MKRGKDELKRGASGESSEPPRTPNDALQYLRDVKERFKDDKKYDEFLEVMREFKAQRIDTTGVIKRVKELFKGHNKLIVGFNTFLPEGYEIVLPEDSPNPKRQKVEFDHAIDFVNKIKSRFEDNAQVYKAFLEILNKYRNGSKLIADVYEEVASLFQDHEDLLEEFTHFLPEGACLAPPSKAARHITFRKDEKGPARQTHAVKKERDTERGTSRVEKERRRADKERDRKDDREREDYDREGDLDGAQRLPHKRKSARRADELIRKQSQNGEVGTHAIFDKIKARMRNRESYQDLLRVLNLYTEQIISRTELQSLVTDVLGKYPDLLEGFNDLFVRCENAEVDLETGPTKVVKVERDQERDKEKDNRDKEKEKERDKEKDRERYTSKQMPSKDKNQNKPISELDLSNCERCTPSYRLLPASYARPTSSHRNHLANQVLNDDWVSVTSGSEDYSFKHMRRNQYEESLFRCEDDRFELDMLLESTIVTCKRLEELHAEIQDSGAQFQLSNENSSLTAIHFRCIERVYGDHALEIIDSMRRNPHSAVTVILARLKQKIEEWSRAHAEMNRAWAEVYSKNYHKSLDHRSFYFKQQDKKCLSAKALLSEIKEIHDKKRKEEDYILASVMGNKRVLTPHLKFKYPDHSVHEDLFQIMKYSADEVCSTMEQSHKIMRIWTLLEPMFNVPSRPRGTEDAEEAAKVPGAHSKERDATSGESTASGPTADCQHDTGKDDCATASSKPDTCRRDKMEEVGTSGRSLQDSQKAEGGSKLEEITRFQGQEARFRDSSSRPENEHAKGFVTHARKNEAVGKTEREEGELSPSPDIDETQNGEHFTGKVRSSKGATVTKEDHDETEREPDADGEHDVDADDEGEESGQKYSEDSENASEAGDEGSGSESQDDGSGDHEEEEDGEEDRDEKAESECEAEGMADADDGEASASSDRSSMLCKPLGARLCNGTYSLKNSTVFYGNDLFYIFFRLHQTFYERIYSAKTNAAAAEQKWKATKDSPPPNLYEKFVRVLHNLLDGSADNNKFEDECRSIIGTQSYVLFTLDKLIYKLVKQLQSIASDEAANKLLTLFSYERSRAPNSFSDLIYHANTCVLLHDDSIYRFEHKLDSHESLIQLMDGSPEKLELPASAMEFQFSGYLNDFLLMIPGPNETKVSNGEDVIGEHVYLNRNKHIFAHSNECDALMDAMKNVQVVNGLEHKISCRDSKVSYVLDTEDLFHRRKHRAATDARVLASAERRKRKFQEWIAQTLS